ncbi:MAG: DUF1971 domain-containing protein [Methylococcales symbiont of Iophon sp. n. MRB-2018]|nr:MAG: DUF1971 domain-containing protein [Methylococcales symbiont of Iophon sp. n. MRB-2018]KAF3979305.1 MAG: DUF1971 domain-containing protein [Methylococcales symbiont of Iophon sp. n. MRB-2018]
MKILPKNVTAKKKTPEFDELSIPKGLLNEHQTKAGVWGKMNYKIANKLLSFITLHPDFLTVFAIA